MGSYLWYIETDPFINEAVAAFLASEGKGQGHECQIIDNKGKERHVWLVPYRVITLLEKAKKVFPFEYRVFVQSGGGYIRPYNLQKKKKLSVHYRKVKKRLREIEESREQG